MLELSKEFGFTSVYGRPRHPQSQGQVERCNQTLMRSFAKALHNREKCWIPLHGNHFIYTCFYC